MELPEPTLAQINGKLDCMISIMQLMSKGVGEMNERIDRLVDAFGGASKKRKRSREDDKEDILATPAKEEQSHDRDPSSSRNAEAPMLTPNSTPNPDKSS